jgi:hypothetical protein
MDAVKKYLLYEDDFEERRKIFLFDHEKERFYVLTLTGVNKLSLYCLEHVDGYALKNVHVMPKDIHGFKGFCKSQRIRPRVALETVGICESTLKIFNFNMFFGTYAKEIFKFMRG